MQPPQATSPARKSALTDWLFATAAKAAVIVTLCLLLGILLSLIKGAWPAIDKFGLGFLGSSDWDPVQEKFGGWVMIYGTLATSVIALLIAVPISFGIAVFLTEIAPPGQMGTHRAHPIQRFSEMFMGAPPLPGWLRRLPVRVWG